MLYRLIICFLLALTSCQSKGQSNSLRVNLNTEPPTLDSRKATDATSINVLLQLFEGLTRLDRDDKPALAGAQSIDISDNGCIYTFELKEHLWSNGEPVTARDYVETWKSALNPLFPSPFSHQLFCIVGAEEVKRGAPPEQLAVKAIDRKTLQITLKHPTPYFLEQLASPIFYPIHMKSARENCDWAGEAGPQYICNGPFTLKSWEHESEIILEKNRFYWDEKKVHLDSIHLAMIADVATEFYMFEMGELDWAGSPLSALPLEFIPSLKEEGKIDVCRTGGVYFYKLNCDVSPLNNAKVRRALAMAMNRQGIVDHILQANEQIATAIVPGSKELFEDGSSTAKALFEEGLQEEGLTSAPTLTLSYNHSPQHQKIAQAIQQQWHEKLGLAVQLESCDWKVYLHKIDSQNYEIARMGWIGEHHDPISYLDHYTTRDHENNKTGWEHPRYRQLIEGSRYELDGEKRLEMLAEAEEILMDEMPIIPIYFLEYAYMKKPYVKDVHLSSLGIIDMKEARIQQ